MTIILENFWTETPAPNGTWHIKVTNFGDAPISDFTLSVTSIMRVLGEHKIEGGRLVRRAANFHEFAPVPEMTLEVGEVWEFQITGISRIPLHHNDAAKSAWLNLKNGEIIEITPAPLMPLNAEASLPPVRMPEGELTLPFALVPWPNSIDATEGAAPTLLVPAKSVSHENRLMMMEINALHKRLYTAGKAVFGLTEVPNSRAIRFELNSQLANEAYEIEFGDDISITAQGEAGWRYALIGLAQMMHGANTDEHFAFPQSGKIADAPRYDWRGGHWDVCRQEWSFAQVMRFVDILAWYKFNIFHWHLTDDEAWRAEIKAYPELTTIGATRTIKNDAMLPQLGNAPLGKPHYYSQAQMRELVAHAAKLNVEVVPEIEMPGHANAVIAALPFLADPDETPNSYYPLQGYPNNAWNPGVEKTFEVIETIIDEIIEIFPSKYFHIGGDEVAQNAWMQSPKARALMEREGLSDTFELQAWFCAKIKIMLEKRGKTLFGWNELSLGGGIPTDNTILMAWESPEVGIELAKAGYDVVMTPGQAYYLDMAQSDAWFENGAGWAGSVSPEQSYRYEAEGDFPEELKSHMRGIQSCIWCEHMTSVAWFNDLVFPRLLAVGEAGWTEKANKDWMRFAAQARIHPLMK